jgi:NAD(P)-dependent dehydrogenase (short-subunit alcohol dehydrogenase family)
MKKNIIITGAAGNLGKAITQKFLFLGYTVHAIISGRDDHEFIKAGKLFIYRANLMYEPEAENTIHQIVEAAGSIDMVVMTVGGFQMGNLSQTPLDGFEKMYRLNFVTAYNTARHVFIQMENQEGGGQMVFIGARPAMNPGTGKIMVGYALSKSLIFKLSEIINEEGKEKGISSSVVVPSIIDTPQNRKSMPEADFSKWVSAGEIADNIAHLATPAGRQLKETILKVYGDS